MKTTLPDGRIFETVPFLEINYISEEPVYKFVFRTPEREVKSSARHKWLVWDKKLNDFFMLTMEEINIEKHELLIQGWEN